MSESMIVMSIRDSQLITHISQLISHISQLTTDISHLTTHN